MSLGVLWVRKEMANTAACSIWREGNWVRWISERGMSSFSGRGQRTRTASSTSVLKWRGRQARGIHVAWRPWQQAAACTHACARRCSRGSCAGQGAGDPYRITVATPIFPLLSPCEFQPKFELKSNYHQNKSCTKFCKLQIIFWCPELIPSGR